MPMDFLSPFFASTRSHSSSDSHIDDEDLKELQHFLAAHKDQYRTNATMKMAAANFLEAKRKSRAANVAKKRQQQQQQPSPGGGMVGKLSGFGPNIKAKSIPEKLSRKMVRPPRTVSKSDSNLPQDDNDDDDDDKEDDEFRDEAGSKKTKKKKKKKKDKKHHRRKVFQSLADEALAQEEGIRHRRRKMKNIQERFLEYGEMGTTTTMALSTSSLEINGSLSSALPKLLSGTYNKAGEDDEKFIDGLVFFAGEKNEKKIRKLVLKRTNSGISTDD